MQEIKASLLANNNKALTYIYVEYGDYCTKKLTQRHKCSMNEAEGFFIEAVIVLREKVLSGNISKLTNTRNYLYKISENIFLTQLKKERRKENRLPDLVEYYYSDNHLDQKHNIENENLRQATEYAWQQLNEKCKDVIYYFYVDKLRMSHIAELMGFASADVAKTTKARCYKQMIIAADDFYLKLSEEA